jgi:hypothetical protein
MLTLKRYKKSNFYSYAFVAFFVLIMALTTDVVKAQETNGTGIAAANDGVSALLRRGSNRAWQVLFIGDGNSNATITAIILSFMSVFTFIILCIRVLDLYRQSTKPDLLDESLGQLLVSKLVPVMFVFVFIAGNGAFLSTSVLGLRNAGYGIDSKIAATLTRVADVNRIAGNYEGEQKSLESLREKQRSCSIIPATVGGNANPTLKKCLDEFQALVDNEINTGAIKTPGILGALRNATRSDNPLVKWGAVLVEAIGSAPSTFITNIINTYLFLFGLVFSVSVEVSMLIMAFIAPIAVSTSLLSLKPMTEWLAKFAGLVVVKVSYTLSTGAFQIITDTSGGNVIDGFNAFALGLAAPFIAILVAWQSAGIVGSGIEAGVFKLASAGAKMIGGKAAMAAGAAVGRGISKARGSGGKSASGSSIPSNADRVRT